ncbi:hypothetical protein Nepgr_013707 [Nepenthes gracilis]|uniref:Uncharacterized protein n=1 Tax=Nepenthes gracilis TaxID=150966 RepID=A0AAD3XPL8_NEPGR|nr:hypothetical protein Nepgr_013707 [Nepenthes gracilis]
MMTARLMADKVDQRRTPWHLAPAATSGQSIGNGEIRSFFERECFRRWKGNFFLLLKAKTWQYLNSLSSRWHGNSQLNDIGQESRD